MRTVLALTWREIHAAFFSPLAYTVLTIFLFFSGFFFYLVTATSGEASLAGTLSVISFLFLVATPFLTMRLLSEEYRSGTIEMLMTAPVTDAQVVLGKFFGALAFYLFMLLPTLAYVAVLKVLGRPDLGLIASSYAGLALMGAPFIALGLFCSALTRNQIVAGVLALVLLLMGWVLGSVSEALPPALRPIIEYAGTLPHLRPFSAGRIPFRDVFFFLSLTAFWLFLSVRALESIRLGLAWFDRRVTARRFVLALNVWTMVALACLALLISNAVVAGMPQTYGWFLDLSANRVHALSGQTRNILAHLPEDVRITILMGKGEVGYSDPPVEIGPQVKDLVQLYQAASRRVQVASLDAYRDKAQVEQVAQRVKGKLEADSLLVECAGRNVQVPFSALVDLPPPSLAPSEPAGPVAFKGEEKLTSAIVRVTEEKPATVYFLSGHGEQAPEGAEGKALNLFAQELRRDNYTVAACNLLKNPQFPADCDLLVIAGPTAAFQDSEVELLRGYLERNGKLLVLVRPRPAKGLMSGLDRLLGDYNVQVLDQAVVIEVYRVGGAEVKNLSVIISDFAQHPVTRDLESMNVVLENVSPVRAAAPDPLFSLGKPTGPASPWAVEPLMQSSASSWGETNIAKTLQLDPDEDARGPLPLAVAVQRRTAPNAPADPAATPRLVVIGSTNVATDAALAQYEANRTLLMNSVNWLARKETKLGIPPQRTDRHPLNADPRTLRVVFFLTVLALPLLAAGAGGLVWWARRT